MASIRCSKNVFYQWSAAERDVAQGKVCMFELKQQEHWAVLHQKTRINLGIFKRGDFLSLLALTENPPYENRHPHILTVLVDVPPRVLDDLPLGVGQRLRALRTVLALHLSSLHSQQLRRWRGQRRRLPARHPPAAQQPGGSQQRPGEVGSEGGGEGDGELRPHGGSLEERRDEKRSREEEEESGRREEADGTQSQEKERENEAPLPPTELSHSKLSLACTPSN